MKCLIALLLFPLYLSAQTTRFDSAQRSQFVSGRVTPFVNTNTAPVPVPVTPSVTSGLVSWYPLYSDFVDNWSGGNNGTATGSPTFGAGPTADSLSVLLNGSTQYIDIGPNSNITPPAITVVAWVKFVSLAPAYSSVLVKVDGITGIQFYVKSNGKLAVYLSALDAPVNYDGSGSQTLSTGTWYQIAFSYDNVVGLIGYVNSTQDNTAPQAGTLAPVATGDMYIGNDSLTAGRLSNAYIEGVKIYNRVLSGAEITSLFNDGR